MYNKISEATVLLAALLCTGADAFWGKGHLLVARRAEKILSDTAPASLAAALKELNALTVN